MDGTQPKTSGFKLLTLITALFCTVLVISNVVAVKIVPFVWGLSISGATIIFPIMFIFNDILTEVYGYSLSRRVIWTGFACLLFSTFAIWLIGILPSASFWTNQEAYKQILGAAPRIALASMLAYFFGEISNSIVLSKMKFLASGKRGLSQAWRFIASTIVGEGVDSIIFMTVAFGGVLATRDLLHTMIGIYLFKVAYEILATPLSTRVTNWIKKHEGVDQIDAPSSTNYNPFQALI